MIKKILVILTSFTLIASPLAAQEKSYWLTGGLIGAGVGFGSGLWIAYGACTLAEEGTNNCRKSAMPIGAVLTGGLGFGLGALIGSAFKKKSPVARIIIDPQAGTYGAALNIKF